LYLLSLLTTEEQKEKLRLQTAGKKALLLSCDIYKIYTFNSIPLVHLFERVNCMEK